MSYKEIGKQLQIEGQFCHNKFDGTVTSRETGVVRFNEEAEKLGLKPLRDPQGYMTLDDNVYQAIKEAYESKYDAKAQEIEDGFSVIKSTYAIDSLLDKLDTTVRKDSKRFTPEGMVYGDLRFVRNTPEIQEKIDTMVDKRVEMTLKYQISRSVDDESFMRTFNEFVNAGRDLANTIQPTQNQELTL